MDTISERVYNYIKFEHIKEFVEDLISVYDNDEPLFAYKNFMDEVDLLTEETADFVNGFRKVFSGKHRAKYCDGVYVNIPKFLSLKDENEDTIKQYLDKIALVFSSPENCKEYNFYKVYSKKIILRMKSAFSEAEQEEKDLYSQEVLKSLITEFLPDFQQTKLEFKEANLNTEMFFKMMLLTVYDKLDCDDDNKDNKDKYKTHFKKIIKELLKTSLKDGNFKNIMLRQFMCMDTGLRQEITDLMKQK